MPALSRMNLHRLPSCYVYMTCNVHPHIQCSYLANMYHSNTLA